MAVLPMPPMSAPGQRWATGMRPWVRARRCRARIRGHHGAHQAFEQHHPRGPGVPDRRDDGQRPLHADEQGDPEQPRELPLPPHLRQAPRPVHAAAQGAGVAVHREEQQRQAEAGCGGHHRGPLGSGEQQHHGLGRDAGEAQASVDDPSERLPVALRHPGGGDDEQGDEGEEGLARHAEDAVAHVDGEQLASDAQGGAGHRVPVGPGDEQLDSMLGAGAPRARVDGAHGSVTSAGREADRG